MQLIVRIDPNRDYPPGTLFVTETLDLSEGWIERHQFTERDQAVAYLDECVLVRRYAVSQADAILPAGATVPATAA